jgi:hypothetical protein
MATAEHVEAYLNKLGRRYERIDDATYLVAVDPNQPPIALRVAPPVIVAQVQIGAAPSADSADSARLFRRLLSLNAQGLMHVAYALENQTIVLCAARELDTLDLNELEAVFADIGVALAEHVPLLRQMATKGA